MIPIIEIIKIKNPFNPTCRESEQVIFVPGKRLTEYIDEPDIDYILNSNFVEQPELTYPSDGDQIVIMPHVGSGLKKILGMIAMIALSVYTGNISSGLWTAGKVGLTSYLAAGAVMVVGGKLINTMFGTKANSLSSEGSSQTYGWNTPSPLSGEGNVIGVTYGECIPAPQILETHIDTVNDKQYLNVLLCGGMGPIDEITDIKIGGNPIANYTDVSYEIRYGTNDQEIIPNFGDTTNNQELSYELSESAWSTQLIDGDNAEGLQITLEFPNGLYHLNDKGNLRNASVTLAVEYRLQGGTWTNWFGNGSHIASTSIAGATCYPAAAPEETWTVTVTRIGLVVISGSASGKYTAIAGAAFDNGKIKFTVPTKQGTYKIVVANNSIISAAQNTAVRRSFRIDNITAGKYEVRAKVTARSAATTSTRDCTTCYWTQLTSIIYDDFSRPNKVLIGIRILATSQLSSGMPSFTWRQKRNTVYVWNPETMAYETRAANNPIWASYDIYHQCRYLKNINTGLYEYTVFGVAHTRLDPYWHEWVECATYADEQVLGTDGTTYEKRFEFDAFFDTAQKRYDAAQQAASVGHATIMPRGNNIGIVCDKPGTMTQVFGEGRTTMASLRGTFSGIEDRATAVEVVFSDTDNDFVNKQFLVRSPGWATSTAAQDNPAQLQLFGVKRKSQAYREGMYTLANNLLITQFVDIGTDIDAMVCQYGDIVGLNHTVSKMGIASGRIVAADTSTVTLDKTVALAAGQSYQIIIPLSVSDVIVKRSTVPVNADTETDTLTVTEPFTVIPAQYDNYMFGEADKAVKPFRLVGVEKSGDLTCKLSLAEYVEGVYTGDLNYPLIDYTPPASTIVEVNSLSLAEESYTQEDGTAACTIHAAWSISRAVDGFIVYTSKDGTNYTLWERTNDFLTVIPNALALITYYVKVCTVLGGIQSTGTIRNIYLSGRGVPNAPGNFQIIIDKQIKCTWDKSIESDFDFYELRIDANTGNEAGMLAKTIANEVYPVLTSRIGTLYLYAHNRSGKYSESSVLGYNIPAPAAPTVTIAAVFQGIVIACGTLPQHCLGINIHVNDGASARVYFSQNNSYTFKTTGGIYDIQVAYVDLFGEGELSAVIEKVVKATIDPTLIAAESLSLEKMDALIKAAVAKAQISIDQTILDTALVGVNENLTTAIDGVNSDLTTAITEVNSDLTTAIAGVNTSIANTKTELTTNIATAKTELNTTIANTKSELNTSITALDSAKVSNTIFTNKVNELAQVDTANKSLITQNASSITSIIGTLNSAADASGQYSSISSIKQTANEIITTLGKAPNDVGQYTAISSVKATADAITTTLAKAPNAAGQYTAITTLKTTADGLATTVSANKTATDSSISTVSQKADSIITTLAKAPDATGQYTAITQLKTTADGLAITVSSNKTATDSAITTLNATADGLAVTVAANKTSTDSAISTISQKADTITATLGKAPDASGQYTAITQLKATADGLSSTVASNKTSTDSAISTVSQTASSIITTLGKAPNAVGQYSAISTLKQTTDTLASTIVANKTDADGKITTANSNITQTANSLTSTVAELNKDPFSTTPPSYTAFSKIKQTTDAINTTVATKANAADLTITNNNITATVAKLNSAPDAVGQYSAISQLKQTADAITSTVSNISVGGSNLFLKSGNFGSTITNWFNNGGGLVVDTVEKYRGYNTIKTTVGGGIVGNWYKLENNVEYTYSIMLKSSIAFTGASSTPTHFHVGLDNVSQSGKINVLSYNTSYTASDVGKYKLLSITFKLISDADSFQPFVYFGTAQTCVFNIAYLKLEKGNIATDWTPAPEDIDYALSQITQTTDSITSIVTANKVAQDGVNTTTSTAIAQANSDIQLRATKANLVSLINVCPETISLKSKLVHIAGDTVIDDNVIVGRMLSANSITADKMATGSITIGHFDSSTAGLITTAQTTANTAQATANSKASQSDIDSTLTEQNLTLTFNNISGVTITGNNVAKTSTTSGNWDAGFSSTRTLSNGDYAEYTVSVLAKGIMFGLSNVLTNHIYTTIDFAIYQTTANTVAVYEEGVSKGTKSTVLAIGDKLRVAIENNQINYYQNGVLLYTSLTTPTLPLILNNSFASIGSKIDNVTVGTMLSGVATSIATAQNTADVAKANALTAQNTANTAVTNASTANTLLTDIADDNKLTALEKHTIKKEWDSIVSEVTLNDAQATTFSITTQKTTYDSAYSALNTYITPLLTNLAITSVIVGTTLRSTFKAYYDARTSLLNAIASKAKTLADTAQTQANLGVTNASTAQTTANTAVANAATAQNTANTATTNAGTANALLADIASDAKLTANEKVTIKQTWDSIVSEYTLNLAQATTFTITTTKAAYTTAYTALSTYITPLLTSLTTTSAIVRATFNSNFKAYYDARTNLLNAIALSAKTLADTAQDTADTKTTQLEVYNSYIDQVNPLVFNHITNVTVTGNDIEKTGGVASTWDASFSATRLLYNGNYAEYTVGILGHYIMFGLCNSWVNASYTSIDYTIYQNGSSVTVYENGVNKSITGVSVVVGDKLRVAIENNQVKYYKNGVLFYTSLTTPTLPMVIGSSFYSIGGKINDVTIGTTILADMAKLTATAQTSANTANSLLADIADDNKLTPLEKHTVQKEWDVIKSEYSLNLTLGTAMVISTTAYTTAYNALNTYITPLLASLVVTSAVVGTTFRANFKAYYDAKVALLNAISTSTEATANTAVTNAATAQTQANLGVTNAATANALLADMSNDAKLTPIEKQSLQQTWSIIGSEYTLNLAQATAMAVSATAYTTAYNTLNTYVPPLLTSLTTTSAIVGTTYRANFKAYYDARTNLLNAIATATEATANTAVTNASNAQTTANNAVTAAATAQTQANLGVANAATANAALADMASDTKLTPLEKQSLQQTWELIKSEYALNLAQGTSMAISTTSYTTAYNTLNTYVPPFLTAMTTTSTIIGTTFRANFKAYYDAKIVLLNAIATSTEATANQAVANAATAQTQANLGVTNAATANAQLTAWKKTGTTQIDGGVISTNSVTADKLQIGSTTGARTEIVNNLIRVYDANNVLRVRMGVW